MLGKFLYRVYFHFQGTQCLIAIAIALTQNKSVKAVNLNRPFLYSQEVGKSVCQCASRERCQLSQRAKR